MNISSLTKKVGASFLLKIFGGLIVLPISVLLARTLGVEEFGRYSFAIALLGILNYVGCLGQDQNLVKNSSIFVSDKRKQPFEVINAGLISLFFSLFLSVFIYLVDINFQVIPESYTTVVHLMLLILPIYVVRRVFVAALRCLGKPIHAILPETLIYPITFFLLVYFTIINESLLIADNIMLLTLLAYAASLLVIIFLYTKHFNYQFNFTKNVRSTKHLIAGGIPFCLLASVEGMGMYSDKLIVGGLLDSYNMGLYQVASRLTDFALFFESAILLVSLPIIAKFFVARDPGLVKFVTKQSYVMCCYCLILLIGVILFGDFVLSIFGDDFTQSKSALIILMLGYFIASFFGPSTFICTVTGLEKEAIYLMVFSLLVNILLLYTLTPEYGLDGAALSKAISEIIKRFLAFMLLYKRKICNSCLIQFKL